MFEPEELLLAELLLAGVLLELEELLLTELLLLAELPLLLELLPRSEEEEELLLVAAGRRAVLVDCLGLGLLVFGRVLVFGRMVTVLKSARRWVSYT